MVTAMLLLIVVALVVGRCAGACLRVTDRSRWHQLRRRGEVAGLDSMRRDRTACCEPGQDEAMLPASRAANPLEVLQRRFASGDISVEQYEREVGRLYGIRS